MPIPAPSSTLGPGPDRPLPAPSPPADESKTVVIPVGGTQAEDVVGAPAESQDGSEPDAPEPFEPTIFQESSTAGRAPWHLPKGFTPPGLSADGLRLGDIDARAASVVGPGHRCQEPAIARQDAYLLRRSADGRHLIVAVADGVSQSRQADLGARLAVSAAARGAAEVLDRGGDTSDIDPVILFKSVAGEMIGTARNQSLAARDVYSILVVAVIPTGPGPDGRRTMWTAQIGDVSVWTLRSGLLTQRTGPDKSGMDKNTLKYVLPDDPAAVRQAQIELRAGDAVAVMTDGFSESLLNIAGVAEFFSRRWAPGPPHPAVFLHDLCYDAPGQSDDRTVVTAWVGDVERDTGRAT